MQDEAGDRCLRGTFRVQLGVWSSGWWCWNLKGKGCRGVRPWEVVQ